MRDREERLQRGEPIEERRPDTAPRLPLSDREVLTVDEAAERFGVQREDILAELENNAVPFEVEIPAPKRRARRGS
jgi:hypothetical protein